MIIRLQAWLGIHKRKIGTIAIGHTFKHLEELLFDFGIYPIVIAWLGTLMGGLVMMALSAFVCWLYLLFYDWAKTDWLGLELLKEARDGDEKHGRIAKLFQRITRRGNWLAFLVLSFFFDPFVTTAYMRHGAHTYAGLSSRDWKIFWASVFVANVWWTGLMSIVVAAIRALLSWLGFI
ncbi:MAG TPA: hypothetical protein VJH69_03585 [Candidatus Paceibacterota bacterium]